jgi:hypothetical protein
MSPLKGTGSARITPIAHGYQPGTCPGKPIWAPSVPPRCLCTWSAHDLRHTRDGMVFELKYRHSGCPAWGAGGHE